MKKTFFASLYFTLLLKWGKTISYNNATVALPLLLKRVLFLKGFIVIWTNESENWINFAVADKRNDAVVGYLCKGKPAGFV